MEVASDLYADQTPALDLATSIFKHFICRQDSHPPAHSGRAEGSRGSHAGQSPRRGLKAKGTRSGSHLTGLALPGLGESGGPASRPRGLRSAHLGGRPGPPPSRPGSRPARPVCGCGSVLRGAQETARPQPTRARAPEALCQQKLWDVERVPGGPKAGGAQRCRPRAPGLPGRACRRGRGGGRPRCLPGAAASSEWAAPPARVLRRGASGGGVPGISGFVYSRSHTHTRTHAPCTSVLPERLLYPKRVPILRLCELLTDGPAAEFWRKQRRRGGDPRVPGRPLPCSRSGSRERGSEAAVDRARRRAARAGRRPRWASAHAGHPHRQGHTEFPKDSHESLLIFL